MSAALPGAEMAVDESLNDNGLEFAVAAARLAGDHKAENVAVLDLRGLSTLTDFFVVATGTSDRQMRAVLDAIAAHARTLGRRPFGVAAGGQTAWLLADYIDVVIHLFDEQHRSFYDLDSLWGDAPRIEWQG